jgi:hypothetical protein
VAAQPEQEQPEQDSTGAEQRPEWPDEQHTLELDRVELDPSEHALSEHDPSEQDRAGHDRAERPHRVLKTAAGAALFVGTLWGLHDQFTPDATAVNAQGSAPFGGVERPAAQAQGVLAGPQVAAAQVVTTATPQAAPRPQAPKAPAATTQQPRTRANDTSRQDRTKVAVPNPAEIVLDVARYFWGR